MPWCQVFRVWIVVSIRGANRPAIRVSALLRKIANFPEAGAGPRKPGARRAPVASAMRSSAAVVVLISMPRRPALCAGFTPLFQGSFDIAPFAADGEDQRRIDQCRDRRVGRCHRIHPDRQMGLEHMTRLRADLAKKRVGPRQLPGAQALVQVNVKRPGPVGGDVVEDHVDQQMRPAAHRGGNDYVAPSVMAGATRRANNARIVEGQHAAADHVCQFRHVTIHPDPSPTLILPV